MENPTKIVWVRPNWFVLNVITSSHLWQHIWGIILWCHRRF